MKNKILLSIVGILSICLIIEVSFIPKTNFFYNEEEENTPTKVTMKVKNTTTNQIEEIDLEEYIIGVISAEMPALFDDEALKAQAVASRTYALYKKNTTKEDYDIVTDITNQVYISISEMQEKWGNNFETYYEKIKKNVNATAGEVLTFQNEIIQAFYFSMSNGYTENSEAVFSESKPYLEGVSSEWENESINNFEVTKTINTEEFCKTLNIDCSNITIENINRSESNRVNTLTINNKTFSGTEIRFLLSLRSTDFEIEIIDNNVNITTKGYGHGVGMSQYGANEMAKIGYTYKEILTHYYQNIEISKIM